MERLAGIGEARMGPDAAADRFDIGRARPGLGAAELLDDRGILALGFGDVARVEIAQPAARRPV